MPLQPNKINKKKKKEKDIYRTYICIINTFFGFQERRNFENTVYNKTLGAFTFLNLKQIHMSQFQSMYFHIEVFTNI